jgi:hypothetical protein
MPIFARTKLLLQEDCFDFAGEPLLHIDYEGPNPHLAYNKIKESLWTIFGVKETERVQERDYKWNKVGNKEDFSVSWQISKDMDRFSYLYLKVKMKGFIEKSEAGKEGKIHIEVAGVLRTEYPQDNIWERSIFYEIIRTFWHKVFYQYQRERYIDKCREIMTNFTNEMKAFFNLIPKE